MFLKELEIEGYKNFRNPFSISFRSGLNVLVGENGSGKSAVIDAVRLLLPEDEFGRNPILESDFYRPFGTREEETRSFQVKALFGGLSKIEKVAFLPWSDGEGHASLTLLVENQQNVRGRYKRSLWGGNSRSSIFESELLETINCVYLPALRDAEARLTEGRSSRLARLLKNLNRQLLKEAKKEGRQHPLVEKVRRFNEDMAGDEGGTISQANSLIRERLIEALGEVFGQETQIQFSEASFSRIAESLRLLFFPEAGTSVAREQFRSLEQNSLGYNNLLYILNASVVSRISAYNDL